MKLRAIRETSGKTQMQVAERAKISVTQYQNIEYGTSKPVVDTALLIAEALNVKSLKEFKEIFGTVIPENFTKPDGNQIND